MNKKSYFSLLVISLIAYSAPLLAENCAGSSYQRSAAPNIVDTAKSAGQFNTLVSLLQSSGLDKVLSGPGPYTVFAPTDEAFAKVPQETLASLQADPEKLKNVLTYHVVSGKVPSNKVTGLSSAETVQGSQLKIDTSKGVMIDNAQVVKTDIMASNGVIHVIDTVLIPNMS